MRMKDAGLFSKSAGRISKEPELSNLRQLVMPKLGLTMTEGAVLEWPVAEGARFERGAVYLVVETDKVANEVEAPDAGKLVRILVPQGETVPVGTVLAEWEAETGAGEGATPPAAPAAPPAAPASPAAHERRWRKPSSIELGAARKLVESKQQIPHFYLATEIEVSRLQEMRERWNAERGHPRITLTHLLVAAVARAMARHPDANRVWEKEGFVELDGVDVGIAVHTERGLLAPVLRRADSKGFEELVRDIGALIERARTGALRPDDVGGGAITVSNAGMHDVTWMSSIINPGQAAILGVGAERRVFRPDEGGAPRLAREVGVVLSCDHRVLDGVRGLAFLNEVRTALEAPQALFT
jgi:pyruvate dehydrogenase E2 component (dihydrolipoamide acetyltransferase)